MSRIIKCPECGEELLLTPDENESNKGIVIGRVGDSNTFGLVKRYKCVNYHEFYITIIPKNINN